MTLVLTTESNPGTAAWTDASILGGGSWIQFADPGDGGTLDTLGKSGQLSVTSVPGMNESRAIAAPTVLGQMLALTGRLAKSNEFTFSNPINVAGNTGVSVEFNANGVVFYFIAMYVSFGDGPFTLAWRQVSGP